MLFCAKGSFLFPLWVVYSFNGLKITIPMFPVFVVTILSCGKPMGQSGTWQGELVTW